MVAAPASVQQSFQVTSPSLSNAAHQIHGTSNVVWHCIIRRYTTTLGSIVSRPTSRITHVNLIT